MSTAHNLVIFVVLLTLLLKRKIKNQTKNISCNVNEARKNIEILKKVERV